jgi:hypothetical protein
VFVLPEKNGSSKRVIRSKAERFEVSAVSRMALVLAQIDMLGALGDKSRYEYTPEQVEKVFSSLDSAISSAKAAFSESSANKPKFSFD